MGTDRYAYASKLRSLDPIPKLWLALGTLVCCLFCESIAVGLFTLVLMGTLTAALGGVKARVLLRFFRVPLAFLVIGCLTIVVRPIPTQEGALWSAWLLGRFLWGVTPEYLYLGAMVLCKALGAIACMYFLSLNTPMTDLTAALERLHVPRLLVELMELIYRFIFVFADTAHRIRVAQESRLGYQGFSSSIRCLGELASVLFLRAWRQGDRVWCALESRGYTGALRTLPGTYEKGLWLYAAAAAAVGLQVLVLFAERRLVP